MALIDTGDVPGDMRGTGMTTPVVRVPMTVRRRIGTAAVGVGIAALVTWLGWRLTHLPLNPIAVVVVATELAGVVATIAVTTGLARAGRSRSVYEDDSRDSHRFAFAMADLVGRTRSSDVHRDVRQIVRQTQRQGLPRRSAEGAMLAVMLEGARRLVLVVAISAALVFGSAVIHRPPVWAIGALILGSVAVSMSHVLLGQGRIAAGDRLRWSFSSMGEVVGATDVDGVAPRRWVGTVAVIAVLNLTIALRGMSDRWTHGLPPMDRTDRTAAMAWAITLVLGALFTMRTTNAPVLDDAMRARRLEERTARQSALLATVAIGLVGLLAGVLPGGVDPTDGDPVRIEQSVDLDAEVTGG